MAEKSKISNLRIANKMFAKYLESKKLIKPNDNLIEITASVVDSVTMFLENQNSKNVIMHNVDPDMYGVNFNPDSGVNDFICNGVFSTTGCYTRRMLETGSFNIGICSNDPKEYRKAKDFYQKFGKVLVAIGVPIDVHEEELNEGKIYLLSYRAKK